MNTAYENNNGSKRMTHALIRPAWTPVTIAMMIIGFMIFWPLGLAMIAYILWGDRLDEFKSGVNARTDRFTKSWSRDCGSYRSSNGRSGNVAFDEWRDAEIDRLAEERRKLEEMRADFEKHIQELRRAKDKTEFETFMETYKRNTQADNDVDDNKSAKRSSKKL